MHTPSSTRPRVVLLGGGGLVGSALAHQMARDGKFAPHVVDQHPPSEQLRDAVGDLSYTRLDLLREDLTPVLAGARGVVHLAAQVDPPAPREREAMRRLHVEGVRRALAASVESGVEHFLLCSSAVVYGAWPDNPLPLDEHCPRRPNPGFPYALDKVCQEASVEAHPAVLAGRLALCVARPGVVYGPAARNYLSEMWRFAPGVLPAVDDRRPPLQFVHVEDVARALLALLRARATGVYNVAPPDWLPYEEVARLAGCRVVPLSGRVLSPLLDLVAPHMPRRYRAPSYVLDVLKHPFVMTPEKLCSDVGFSFRHRSADALRAMLGSAGLRHRFLPGSFRAHRGTPSRHPVG